MVENAKENLSEVKNILVDAGYTGENFATQIKATIGATVEAVKRSELHTFAVLPKRWVVERSFAWLEKCRRLWKIASVNSTQVYKWLFFPSFLFY